MQETLGKMSANASTFILVLFVPKIQQSLANLCMEVPSRKARLIRDQAPGIKEKYM